MADPKDFSKTAASNASVGGVNIAEGALTAQMNDSQRAILATLAPPADFGDSAGAIKVDDIAESTAAAGVTIDGVLLKDNAVVVDTINESTASAGVTVDGLLIKDGGLPNLVVDASDTTKGLIEVATDAEVEAATSSTLAVTPGRMNSHPGMAKAWVDFTVNGTVNFSYNVASVTDVSASLKQVFWDTPFADANYVVFISQYGNAAAFNANMVVAARTASSMTFHNSSETNTDGYMVIAYGAQ